MVGPDGTYAHPFGTEAHEKAVDARAAATKGCPSAIARAAFAIGWPPSGITAIQNSKPTDATNPVGSTILSHPVRMPASDPRTPRAVRLVGRDLIRSRREGSRTRE